MVLPRIDTVGEYYKVHKNGPPRKSDQARIGVIPVSLLLSYTFDKSCEKICYMRFVIRRRILMNLNYLLNIAISLWPGGAGLLLQVVRAAGISTWAGGLIDWIVPVLLALKCVFF